MLNAIHTSEAPEAIGPYSQAIKAGSFIFCSGQIGLDKNGSLALGVESQIDQVLINLAAVLKAAGADFSRVVKTTVYLTDLNDFAVVNKIYGKHFKNHKPARATIEVKALPKGALVEIDAVAVI